MNQFDFSGGTGWMTFGDLLLSLVGAVSAVPIYLMLRAYAEGAVDIAVAISTTIITLGLFLLAWQMRETGAVYIFAALMLLVSCGVPFYFWHLDKKLGRQLDDDDIAKYHAALQRDSRNSSAHALLAEAYLKKGFYIEAVAHLEAAITLSPDSDRNPHLHKWTRRLEIARAAKAEWEAKNATRRRV